VVEILSGQRIEAAAGEIHHRLLPAHPDAAAGLHRPVVEFGVLIVGEARVIAADAAEEGKVEDRVMASLASAARIAARAPVAMRLEMDWLCRR
jgi:hypothetical protein